MASSFLLSPPLTLPPLHLVGPSNLHNCRFLCAKFDKFLTSGAAATTYTPHILLTRSSIDGADGLPEAPKSARRGRKKKETDPSPPTPKNTTHSTRSPKQKPVEAGENSDAFSGSDSGSEMDLLAATASIDAPKASRRGRRKDAGTSTTTSKKTDHSKKGPKEEKTGEVEISEEEEGDNDFDDGIDFPYESPPLVCCFGAAQREFIPTVRVSSRQMHPDKYSTWKQLQWNPPEFVRAPGGPPSNVAVSHVRLGGRAAFMGKVGDDEYGNDLVYRLNVEKVQTRSVKIDPAVKTAVTHMKIKFRDSDGKLVAETSRTCAEDSLSRSEVDVAVLKEARIFHFNSEVLLSPGMHPALSRAIKLSKKYGSAVFFDLNLPLPLWESREQTWNTIRKAWNQSDLIEVSKQELEFLLDEDYYEKKRNYRPQYYSESYEQTINRRDYYHYTREELLSLWHDGIKILFVTDGTLRIHYYTPDFDGVVVGTEDVLITPFTCDRTGSGDAVVAGIMRKLTIRPEMFHDKDVLERHLRFAIAAGIISQWTIGAVRGFPTESATQNLKEQVYVPSMW